MKSVMARSIVAIRTRGDQEINFFGLSVYVCVCVVCTESQQMDKMMGF